MPGCLPCPPRCQCKKHFRSPLRGWTWEDRVLPHLVEMAIRDDLELPCLVWTRSCIDGYGQINWKGKAVLTHRLTYELLVGPIPEQVLHHCDNRPCCEDTHLFLGNNSDNVADRVAKGRSADNRGVLHPRAKLTEWDVLEIRRLKATGLTQKELGEMFGILPGSINNIVKKRSWSHVL